jgi:hypothetical protein
MKIIFGRFFLWGHSGYFLFLASAPMRALTAALPYNRRMSGGHGNRFKRDRDVWASAKYSVE